MGHVGAVGGDSGNHHPVQDVGVATGHGARGMAKQCRDGGFSIAKTTSNASEAVPQGVQAHIRQARESQDRTQCALHTAIRLVNLLARSPLHCCGTR